MEGSLAVRTLSKGKDSGIYQPGIGWKDYTFDFTAQISVNPHCSSGIGWMVGHPAMTAICFGLRWTGKLRRYLRCGGIDSEIYPAVTMDQPLPDNMRWQYGLKFMEAESRSLSTGIVY